MIEYEHLVPNCDLSSVPLEEAARMVGPAFTYELRVAPIHILYARRILKQFGADTLDHPLSPYISLVEDSELGTSEWVLCANGKCAGSKGVW